MNGEGISIVLPVYNEENSIEHIIQSVVNFIPSIFKHYEVILVNDGSNDATENIIRKITKDSPCFKGIHFPENKGYGTVLIEGFRVSKYPLVLFMDADEQFLISDLNRLIPYVDSFDIIIGNRAVRSDPWHRVLIGKLYNFLICSLFRINIKDITCGFKLIKKSVFDELQLESRGGFINAEMLIKALRRGYLVKEVNVKHYPRRKGKPTGAMLCSFLIKIKEMFKAWYKYDL